MLYPLVNSDIGYKIGIAQRSFFKYIFLFAAQMLALLLYPLLHGLSKGLRAHLSPVPLSHWYKEGGLDVASPRAFGSRYKIQNGGF
jgi:hypothetical protein